MKQKLELTWVGKDIRPSLEPRVLLLDEEKSFTASARVTDTDVFDNRLIFGDNLLALKALEQELAGKVKCIFIDPPYNTGSAFEHYDDGLEHSLWLSMMRDRLELLRTMLSEDGSIWIAVDDNEAHYLKVLCDEIFGRRNFIANVLWQKRTSPEARLRLGAAHDHILVYAQNSEKTGMNQLPISEDQKMQYKNPDNDPKGLWVSTDFTAQGYRPNQMYKIETPSGVIYEPPEGRCWSNIESEFIKLIAQKKIWFGVKGDSRPRVKNYLIDAEGISSWTWWSNKEVGHNQESKKESIAIFDSGSAFATPKPERLLERIIHIATNPGDIVLDSFAGSGTTGAVAHKMGRRWVMIEVEPETPEKFIIPRLQKVIDGTDQGGISSSVGWKGGGGFRYYHLAKSVLKKDKWDNWIINPEFNADRLSEAMCKIEGYAYSPSSSDYWNHGYGTENNFIFVTTQYLSLEQLQSISEEVGAERSLLVMASSFAGGTDFPNLILKKIPQSVLHKCEWDHDDYSLKIENLPMQTSEPAEVKQTRKPKDTGVPNLFSDGGNA